ncbi:cation/acetate symporter ActP [Chromobacterium alkanivorans]|uniref:sodium:solute symporter family transporter n=1 Tax=Chromobacterium alkanivorans TaxID=1071719 RepID=UPI001966FE1B|nr:sodium/solute symporter [Chromobacterium alkanivorans]MBN3002581.1 cation/acetate symporter ActP [Chromobacterium alkanivorans]
MSHASAFFLLFVLLTLAITAAAARRTASAGDFYTAGGRIRGWQNGLALAGDYLSAAAFLGAAGMYLSQGYDSLAYAVGTLAGWPLLLLLLAEKLRGSGCYTAAAVLGRRFDHDGVRLAASVNSLTVTLFYLIVQMVGAGKLIELLFGLPYLAAVSLVGALMVLYVALGGMLATTWVQMVKAALMFGCALLLAGGVLARFDGDPARLFAAVEALRGPQAFLPSPALSEPLEVLSLGLGLCLGLLGLPHVLMRFFTVPDRRAARQSACFATGLIALFFAVNIVIGYGALALVTAEPGFHDAAGKLLGGGNMAAIHLATLLGGPVWQGLVAAVAFATILAVVAGLAMAGASAISHDLYAAWWRRGRADANAELRVSRWATVGLGLLALLLSTLFQQQNIAFLMGLAFAIAASANFPVLLLALHWPGLSARGALWGSLGGLAAAAALIVAGPAVWVGALGHAKPLFPYANPALFSVPLAFALAWLGSRRGATAVSSASETSNRSQRS